MKQYILFQKKVNLFVTDVTTNKLHLGFCGVSFIAFLCVMEIQKSPRRGRIAITVQEFNAEK